MSSLTKTGAGKRIFTKLDVSVHNTSSDCWLSRGGKVYNVTSFLHDHPGGEDLILPFAGKDLKDAMEDGDQHVHSNSAYDMLEEFVIGRIGTEAAVVSEDWIPEDDFHPEDTDTSADFEKCEFLDLGKPLLKQLWFSDFSKAFYLQQVHQPRHLPHSARLFGNSFLEMFTLTPWYVVPMIWAPITAYIFRRSVLQFSDPMSYYPSSGLFASTSPLVITSVPPIMKTIFCFFIGNLIWTILEYILHRFLFHMDTYLPDHPYCLTLHFLLHGVHHYLPMDRLRLVMPPLMFTALSFPFTRLGYFLFPASVTNGIIAGSFTFYILYDTMHYALHHTKLPAYLRDMKKYHLAHHYKNFELGFGVTSPMWDYVFRTVLAV